jgi:hypothetical protein
MRSSRIAFVSGSAAAALVAAGLVGGYNASAQQDKAQQEQAGAQQDELPSELVADLGEQLTGTLSVDGPFKTDLPDHLWVPGDENANSLVFVHLDKPAPEAMRVLYTGFGIKGRWCAEDQQKIEELAGEGFTHFHRIAEVASPDAGHGGGEPGEEGYWLKHVAVGEPFEMPWGQVEPGKVDMKFMPTEAPTCGS